MIQVYVLVTFWDENGIHKAGTFTEVKEENFNSFYMQRVSGYTKAETDALLDEKQDDLTAGTNIQISDQDVISATDTGDTVSVAQVQSTGTKIATITVNSVGTDIYAPASSGVAEDVIADEFGTGNVPGTTYNAGDYCIHSSKAYKCTGTTSGTWNSSKWSEINCIAKTNIGSGGEFIGPFATYQGVKISNSKFWVGGTGNVMSSWTDSDFTSAGFTAVTNSYNAGTYVSYSAGDFVMHSNKLYKCTGSTTGASWDSTKWSETQVTDEVGGSSGATNLDDLSDVNASSPSINDTLIYDGHYWSSHDMNLGNLSDIVISSATDGQVLTYDDATGKWKNANASGGGGSTPTTYNVTDEYGQDIEVSNFLSGGQSAILLKDANDNAVNFATLKTAYLAGEVIIHCGSQWSPGKGDFKVISAVEASSQMVTLLCGASTGTVNRVVLDWQGDRWVKNINQ